MMLKHKSKGGSTSRGPDINNIIWQYALKKLVSQTRGQFRCVLFDINEFQKDLSVMQTFQKAFDMFWYLQSYFTKKKSSKPVFGV